MIIAIFGGLVVGISAGIYRWITQQNPTPPNSVKTAYSIATNNNTPMKLSTTKLQNNANNNQSHNQEGNQSGDYYKLVTQNPELKEVVRRNTSMVTADKIRSIQLSFKIPREKYQVLQNVIDENKDFMRVTFDETGLLQHVESDAIESRT
jgi:hypothetical protein